MRKLFETGLASGIQPHHAHKLQQILALLETADTPEDMDFPGLNLHELKGKRKGTYAVKVRANWRVAFVITEGEVQEINYEDYH